MLEFLFTWGQKKLVGVSSIFDSIASENKINTFKHFPIYLFQRHGDNKEIGLFLVWHNCSDGM